jgi:RNA polymerase sigma-70 factor (ECF subfamily)
MNWENIIPTVAAPTEVRVAEAAMDSDQFAAFYTRSSRQLWAYLARTSGDPALAEDLMQESFIRFLTSNPPTDGEIASRRYLFRIGTNLLRDHWRRARTVSIDDLPPERSAAPDRSAQCDCRLTLSPALAKLRPRDRQLLWLAHAESYSHREIAEITGLAYASIRLLLFRARREMSKLLTRGDV